MYLGFYSYKKYKMLRGRELRMELGGRETVTTSLAEGLPL
jgi:hypothetical protein